MYIKNSSGQRTTTSLQDDLNNLQDWERDWQMHINPDKCEVIRITTKRKIISSYPRTVPCGTPEATGAGSDATPSTTTLWVRPARKLLIQFKVGLQTQVLRRCTSILINVKLYA
jgi:hypothetical protein